MMLVRKYLTNSNESSLNLLYKYLLLNKYYKPFVSTLVILISGSILLLQTLYFLTHLESVSIVKYSAFYTGFFYTFTTNILYLYIIQFYMPRIKAFSINTRQYGTKLKATYLSFIQVLLISTACVTALTTVYTWPQIEDESNPIWRIMNYYFSLDYNTCEAINRIISLLILTLPYPSSAMPLCFVYVVSHMDLQLLLLTDYVNCLKKRGIKKSGLITKNLKSIVKTHLQIIKYNRSILKSNEIFNMIYVVNGIMINFWSLFTLLEQGFDKVNGVVLLVVFSIYSYCINYVAQNYVNHSTDFINAVYELRWYEWDRECQKFYLIMVTNMSKEFEVPVALLGHVGNNLLKKILRFSYTMKCVLFSAKK